MEALHVIPDLTRKGFDLFEAFGIDGEHREKLVDLTGPGASFEIGAMPEGTREGRPTVIIAADLGDGRVVALETSLRLLSSAVRAFERTHGIIGGLD